MKRTFKATLWAALAFAILAAPARAGSSDQDYAYTSIDPPGSVETILGAISNAGEVAGSFVDKSSVEHGFTWTNGHFTIFDGPAGTTSTSANAVNASGRVAVTAYNTTLEIFQGMVRQPGGSFVPESPTVGVSAQPVAINNDGTTTGILKLPSDSKTHGYVHVAGDPLVQFDPPGSVDTEPGFINADGSIVGFFVDSGRNVHGFKRIGSKITTFDIPGALRTAATFISADNKTIAGYYEVLPSVPIGFVMKGKHVKKFEYPNSKWTSVLAVLAHGHVIGGWSDADNETHGFVESGHKFRAIEPFRHVKTIEAQYATVNQVNVHGSIVGGYRDEAGELRLFVGVCKSSFCH